MITNLEEISSLTPVNIYQLRNKTRCNYTTTKQILSFFLHKVPFLSHFFLSFPFYPISVIKYISWAERKKKITVHFCVLSVLSAKSRMNLQPESKNYNVFKTLF